MSLPTQRTLKNTVEIRGTGLHTGLDCRIVLTPSSPNTGIVFATREGDILAHVDNVVDVRRGVTLRSNQAEVHTVEHLLAAFAGMRVDNCRVEVDGIEIPAVDGSALPFVEAIDKAGLCQQGEVAQIFNVPKNISVSHGDTHLIATPSRGFRAKVFISFSHGGIGEQAVDFCLSPIAFKHEIAPARTFCLANDVDEILSMGLGKGGTLENVVVVYDNHYSSQLRFSDEFVRHKALDLIGDLFLVGARLRADIAAVRPGHMLNVCLAKAIRNTFCVSDSDLRKEKVSCCSDCFHKPV